jgi:outer membrane lipoprotein-sorting protein
MTFLRTVSTRRLLALIAVFVAAVGGGTAIAVAASSGGPIPPAKPLANAIHDALAAPQVTGISARISFTNHLIDSSNIEGADPILKGATGRLWLTTSQNVHRLRLELQGDNGDAQAVFNDGSFWAYDPSSNTVYRGKLPQDHTGHASKAKHEAVPSLAQIQSDLNHAMQHATLSNALRGDVAGQPTYSLRVSPKHDGGLLGAASLAWDAVRGIPLRFGIYARGSSSPVLELSVSDISYGPVPASDFSVTPPSNAKVVNVSVPAGHAAARTHARRHGAEVAGVTAVAKRLRFKLLAPGKLVGLPRQSVRLLDWSGAPAALVTYGQNLGGIAVIEQPASSATSDAAKTSEKDHRSLSLPTVSINGVSSQELDTALGTGVRFTRAGVTYTVLGSVPPAAAEAAARQL